MGAGRHRRIAIMLTTSGFWWRWRASWSTTSASRRGTSSSPACPTAASCPTDWAVIALMFLPRSRRLRALSASVWPAIRRGRFPSCGARHRGSAGAIQRRRRARPRRSQPLHLGLEHGGQVAFGRRVPGRAVVTGVARRRRRNRRSRFDSTACAASSEVVFYRIDDGGHTWPGGKQYLPKAIIGPTTRALDASEVIAQFFLTHARD